MNSFEWILGRNKHFRKESHRPEAIASGRNGVLRKSFRPNRTALNIAHFNKIITNRKWIQHLHLYNRGYNNASQCKVKWWCVYKQSDEDDQDSVGVPSNIIYWSCKIILFVSFWFWIFKVFCLLDSNNKNQQPSPANRCCPPNYLRLYKNDRMLRWMRARQWMWRTQWSRRSQ